MRFVVGIDVGGTFTDCVIRDTENGSLVADKAYTTSDNVALGMIDALRNTADRIKLSPEQLLRDTEWLALGTTSLTNRLVSRSGAKVGLITTKGHEDVTIIGRVFAKTEGLSELEKLDVLAWDKPTPIVPRQFIRGFTERVDSEGAVVVSLNQREVAEAVADLVGKGVEAIAVCFLWSFLNPSHEDWVADFVREHYPDVFVITSNRVAPVLGEYERFNSTIISAYLGPVATAESRSMRERFGERGLGRSILVMQSSGGLIWDEEVPDNPIRVLGSGPVGGVVGAARLAERFGYRNVITTDMGGTSFDVGLVIDAQPLFSATSTFERFRCNVPAVEVVSIGAGGGSIAHVDHFSKTLHVGPQSAGAHPGPVCYGTGGTEPTVTDADVVLGRIDPGAFFGGRRLLLKEKAAEAIEERIAKPLGLGLLEAAKGIVDIVDARMADLIRSMTIERGYDPREFVLFSYGGAAPVHVGAYARELGVRHVALSPLSAVFSAFGIASSDLVRFYSFSQPMTSPFDLDRLNSILERLKERSDRDLQRSEWGSQKTTLSYLVDMRFRFQIHEIRVDLPRFPLVEGDIEKVVERFGELHEQRFGKGTAIATAPVEIQTFHVVATARRREISLNHSPLSSTGVAAGPIATRKVFFGNEFVDTPVFSFGNLLSGAVLDGPAIIEGHNTTIVVQPGDLVRIDPSGYLFMELSAGRESASR